MMLLINVETNQPVVEFRGDETIFHSKFLEHEMRLMGVPIPHGVRALYEGRDYVFLGNDNFQRAFKEIYYLTSMDHKIFRWQEIKEAVNNKSKKYTHRG